MSFTDDCMSFTSLKLVKYNNDEARYENMALKSVGPL
jgi:hypothetical protein